MRYLSRRERDRQTDNLLARQRELRKQGKEGCQEYKDLQRMIAEIAYGPRCRVA